MVLLFTFGTRHHNQFPSAAKYFDCRVFQNPPMGLYKYKGTDKVLKDLFKQDIVDVRYLRECFEQAIAWCIEANKLHAIDAPVKKLGLYCIGGQHRSVGVSELLRDALIERGIDVQLEHLDVHRND